MPRIPADITRENVLSAIHVVEGALPQGFGPSVDYDLVHEGKRLPPKAVIGVAAKLATGAALDASEFSSGIGPGQACRVLHDLGFRITRKDSDQNAFDNTGSPELVRFQTYSRKHVHDILAPDAPFTPQSGNWGLHGIVPISGRPGDFVFFVTLGQKVGDHVFDEGITVDGVVPWQSQPKQSLADRQIQRFIEHDHTRNTIYLFLRPGGGMDYYYIGTLRYVYHFPDREKPVWFHWQVNDWNPDDVTLPYSVFIDAIEEPEPSDDLSLEPRRARRQGLIQDPVVRRAIELRAMEVARQLYKDQQFEVEDTSATHPYDLRCVRATEEVRVEVKGTRSDGESVYLTRGEVLHARAAECRTDLLIIGRIVIARSSDGVQASGGDIVAHLRGWVPEDEHLCPTQYEYRIP